MPTPACAPYPLKLTTPTRQYGFGERLIPQILKKAGLPDDAVIAETWEYSDEPSSPATIINGALAGTTLNALTRSAPDWLVGAGFAGERYPLLGKFLDASHALPTHVHGDDAYATTVLGEPNGKTEAWHIIWVKDEAKASVLAGLKPGVTLDDVRQASLDQDYDRVMIRQKIAPGDTVYVPGGTLHTFGPDTLVFEIQQTSDIGVDVMPNDIYGKPLPEAIWHRRIEETLSQLRPDQRPVPTHGLARFEGHNRRTVCAAGPYFVMERWKITQPLTLTLPKGRGAAITNLVNPVGLSWAGGAETLARAESRVLPAALTQVTLVPDGIAYVLVCSVPDLMDDVVTPLREAGYTDDEIRTLGDLSSVL
ncbi:MAG: hypothetical protein WBA46_00940 [Thermomicrobiales bacterium]